jgi:hypothetical protein
VVLVQLPELAVDDVKVLVAEVLEHLRGNRGFRFSGLGFWF